MNTYRIKIEGMGCMHCVNKVRDALTAAGLAVTDCVIGEATVTGAAEHDALYDKIRQAVEGVGFDVIDILEQAK